MVVSQGFPSATRNSGTPPGSTALAPRSGPSNTVRCGLIGRAGRLFHHAFAARIADCSELAKPSLVSVAPETMSIDAAPLGEFVYRVAQLERL
jgi:hypothetical protein